jgi:hypothetical protein
MVDRQHQTDGPLGATGFAVRAAIGKSRRQASRSGPAAGGLLLLVEQRLLVLFNPFLVTPDRGLIVLDSGLIVLNRLLIVQDYRLIFKNLFLI